MRVSFPRLCVFVTFSSSELRALLLELKLPVSVELRLDFPFDLLPRWPLVLSLRPPFRFFLFWVLGLFVDLLLFRRLSSAEELDE